MTRLFSTERKSSLIPPATGDDAVRDTQPSATDEKLRQRRQRLQRLHSLDAATFHDRSAGVDGVEARPTLSPGSPQSPRSPPPASPKSAAARRPHSAKSRHGSSTSSSSSASVKKPSLTSSEPQTPATPDSAMSLPTSSPPPLGLPGRVASYDRDAPPSHHAHHGKKKHLTTSTSLPAESMTSPQSHHPVAASAPRLVHPSHKAATTAATAAAGGKKLKHRRKAKKNETDVSKADTSRPLEFPTTPDLILDYHRQKPILNNNEEWLVVELNEYECLVDGFEILRIIAKHSKFFEVEPDQLWEEFFEFVEDVPSYDEIINYDVWQEFRDNKYPC